MKATLKTLNRSISSSVLILRLSLATALVILAVAVSVRSTRPVRAEGVDLSRATTILTYFNDLSRNDPAAAASLMADNAFFVGASARGTCTLQTPCHDRASILQNLQTVQASTSNQCHSVTSIEVTGDAVTGRIEVQNDSLRANGIQRQVHEFFAEVGQDGKIASFFIRNDLSDPQTAKNAAINAGKAQPGTPIPTPNPACG